MDFIKSVQYDFIAIAIISSDIADMVQESLVNFGVPNEKIARMEPDVINIESVEQIMM